MEHETLFEMKIGVDLGFLQIYNIQVGEGKIRNFFSGNSLSI
jgi:hypothetical protein